MHVLAIQALSRCKLLMTSCWLRKKTLSAGYLLQGEDDAVGKHWKSNIMSDSDGSMCISVQVVVSRMRMIASQLESGSIRLVGLSTSLANAKDLGEWMGATSHSLFNFPPGKVHCTVHLLRLQACECLGRLHVWDLSVHSDVLAVVESQHVRCSNLPQLN